MQVIYIYIKKNTTCFLLSDRKSRKEKNRDTIQRSKNKTSAYNVILLIISVFASRQTNRKRRKKCDKLAISVVRFFLQRQLIACSNGKRFIMFPTVHIYIREKSTFTIYTSKRHTRMQKEKCSIKLHISF